MQAWCPCRSRFHRLTQVWCHSSKPHPISSRRPFISSQQRHSRHNVSRSPSTLQIVHARAGCRSVFRRQPDRAKSAPPTDSVTLTRPVVALSPSVSSCDSVISHARTVNKEDSTESPNPPRTDARTTGDQAKMPSSLESSRPIMAPSVRYPATAPPSTQPNQPSSCHLPIQPTQKEKEKKKENPTKLTIIATSSRPAPRSGTRRIA